MASPLDAVPVWIVVDRQILQLYLVRHSALFQEERVEPRWPAFNRWVEHFKVDSRDIGKHFFNRLQKLHYWMVLRVLSRQGRHVADSLLLHAVSKRVHLGLRWERHTGDDNEPSRFRYREMFRNGPFSVSSNSDVVIAESDDDSSSTE